MAVRNTLATLENQLERIVQSLDAARKTASNSHRDGWPRGAGMAQALTSIRGDVIDLHEKVVAFTPPPASLTPDQRRKWESQQGERDKAAAVLPLSGLVPRAQLASSHCPPSSRAWSQASRTWTRIGETAVTSRPYGLVDCKAPDGSTPFDRR